jgi:uncharacterized protein (TIGR04551 family)
MRRSSFTLTLLVLSLFSAWARAQTPGGEPSPAASSDQPAPPAAPSASGRAAAAPAPAAPASAAPVAAPAPAPNAPAPAPNPAPIDRGSLLAPSSAAPAPAPVAAGTPVADTRPADAPSPERKVDSSIGANPKDIYAEDWWGHTRPIFELHGYLRVRAELFHGFSLGRVDTPQASLWPQPADNAYTGVGGASATVPYFCSGASQLQCTDKSQAGANMRFRVNPELHISDNLRIMSQIDMLDNLVLGSTPSGYAPGTTSTTGTKGTLPLTSPYVPIGAFADTQVPPIFGVNSFSNSVAVKRAWGEYATPLGQLRFGRMPNHWGLGILENSGDGYDSDWQSTVDRIMFTTGIKSLDLYVSGAWDFPNEGPTSATTAATIGGQPYDLAQLDDVNQYVLMVAHRRDPELMKSDLAHGDPVINGGLYFAYRDQILAADAGGTPAPLGVDATTLQSTYYLRRDLRQFMPDVWLQLLYKKFRFEAELSIIAGTIGNLNPGPATTFKFMQMGLATETEFKAIEDRLHLQFGFGWASGDGGLTPVDGRTSTLSPTSTQQNGSIYGSRVAGNDVYREFRFHPDYRIDLILNRNILSRVQGEYYFRPSADYDFARTTQGQRFGGGAAVIWSRASEFVQSPGHQRDLGVEFDLSLYYQSKDGSLNDDPNKMGGFYTMLQYGVLFPLGGLGYMQSEQNNAGSVTLETSAAHTIRWYVGVLF